MVPMRASAIRMLAVLALMPLTITLTVALAIAASVTTPVARRCFVLVLVTTPIAITAAITLMAAMTVAIAISTVTTFVPVASTFLRRPASVTRRGRGWLGRLAGAAEQEAPQAHEDADLLDRSRRLDRRDRRLHRDGRRRRNAGNARRDHCWSRRRRRLLLFHAVARRRLRNDRDLVTDGTVLGQPGLVVAHAADLVRRRFHVLVRNEHDLRAALGLDAVEPVALLVHQVGRDFDRQLRDDLDRAVLARFFADESQQRQCERIDAADRTHAAAARAGDARRLADRRPQALARQLQQTEARETPDLNPRAVLAHGIAQTVFDGP